MIALRGAFDKWRSLGFKSGALLLGLREGPTPGCSFRYPPGLQLLQGCQLGHYMTPPYHHLTLIMPLPLGAPGHLAPRYNHRRSLLLRGARQHLLHLCKGSFLIA